MVKVIGVVGEASVKKRMILQRRMCMRTSVMNIVGPCFCVVFENCGECEMCVMMCVMPHSVVIQTLLNTWKGRGKVIDFSRSKC